MGLDSTKLLEGISAASLSSRGGRVSINKGQSAEATRDGGSCPAVESIPWISRGYWQPESSNRGDGTSIPKICPQENSSRTVPGQIVEPVCLDMTLFLLRRTWAFGIQFWGHGFGLRGTEIRSDPRSWHPTVRNHGTPLSTRRPIRLGSPLAEHHFGGQKKGMGCSRRD